VSRIVLALLSFLVLVSPSLAHPRYHRLHAVVGGCIETSDIMHPCAYDPNIFRGVREIKINLRRDSRTSPKIRSVVYNIPRVVERVASEIVGGRPSGCPHAYCGCGTSLHIFGRIIPALNLASNWGRFPRALPAPGMVAYRSGHVFAIEAVNYDGTVIAYDSNSGRGLTRIHRVSLRGFRVVNPHASSAYPGRFS